MSTPRIGLVGASDDLLGQLEPLVRDGKADADPAPFDDPMSLYEDDPAVRAAKWLQGIWRGRGSFSPSSWRLTRQDWLRHRRHDIALHGITDLQKALR